MPVKALLVLLVLLVLAVLIGPYTFLPPLLERMVANNVQEQLRLERVPEVELRSDPPLRMLAGSFSEGRISTGATDLGELRAAGVDIQLEPFDVRVLQSVASGALRLEEQLSGSLQVEISEDEVSRLVRAASDVPVRGVELREGELVVRSSATVIGFEAPASVRGRLVMSDGELLFEPLELQALGMAVPEKMADRLLAHTRFAYPLGDLPYGAEVSGVELQEGRLVLSAHVDGIPVGGSGG